MRLFKRGKKEDLFKQQQNITKKLLKELNKKWMKTVFSGNEPTKDDLDELSEIREKAIKSSIKEQQIKTEAIKKNAIGMGLEEYFKILEIPENVFNQVWKNIKNDKLTINAFHSVFELVVNYKKNNEKIVSWIAPMPSPNYYNKSEFSYLCVKLNIKNDISNMLWNIIKQDFVMCSIFISIFGIVRSELSIKNKGVD